MGCPVPCIPPSCSVACTTGIPCVTPATNKPVTPTPQVIVGPTIPAIPVSYPYPAPPIYAPAPVSYPAPRPMPTAATCPPQCLQHSPQFCPSYCSLKCCRSTLPSYAGKKSKVKRPSKAKSSRKLVLKGKRTHHKL